MDGEALQSRTECGQTCLRLMFEEAMMFRRYQNMRVPVLPPSEESIRSEKEAQLEVVRRLRRKLARPRKKSMPIFLSSQAARNSPPSP